MNSTSPSLRLDKWLWFARFYKTRSLAASQIQAGGILVNGRVVDKPAHGVRPGDRISLPMGSQRRQIEVIALGERRGPAPEAQSLYSMISHRPDGWAVTDPA